jgi:hypothetical protein
MDAAWNPSAPGDADYAFMTFDFNAFEAAAAAAAGVDTSAAPASQAAATTAALEPAPLTAALFSTGAMQGTMQGAAPQHHPHHHHLVQKPPLPHGHSPYHHHHTQQMLQHIQMQMQLQQCGFEQAQQAQHASFMGGVPATPQSLEMAPASQFFSPDGMLGVPYGGGGGGGGDSVCWWRSLGPWWAVVDPELTDARRWPFLPSCRPPSRRSSSRSRSMPLA